MADVIVIGAGPVGATFALLAARPGLAITLYEARPGASGDARTLALSDGSRERLEEALAWPAASVTPIQSIHISQRGGPGRTVLEAAEHGLRALGYTVAYSALEEALHRALEARGLEVRFGERCSAIHLEAGAARVRFESGAQAQAPLLVLADGGANAARIPGIGFAEKDYGQHAVLAAVQADRGHRNRAYERFTPEGPMALLPVGNRYALVWTATPAGARRLVALDEAAFLRELQEAFGDRAGRFTHVCARTSFPLKLRTVNCPVALRTALIGNAAQALHPIAGQGLNLGLRDAAQLAASLAQAPRESLGSLAMLSGYRAARRRDTSRGVAFTDFLVSAFGDGRGLPTWGRGLALAALDLVPFARRLLAQRMIHGAPAP